jgi:hypothetical protein
LTEGQRLRSPAALRPSPVLDGILKAHDSRSGEDQAKHSDNCSDDILIGGATAYDTEAGLVSLQAVLGHWSSTTDDDATRAANLLSSNGVPLLGVGMVTNNGGGNTMIGK